MNCINKANSVVIPICLTEDFGVEKDKEEAIKAGEENFVIANFNAVESLLWHMTGNPISARL